MRCGLALLACVTVVVVGCRSAPDAERPAPAIHAVVVGEPAYRVRIVGAGTLLAPVAVAVGPDGRIYVADAGRARIEIFDPEGRSAGSLGAGRLQRPKGVAVAGDGTVYVTDVFRDRVIAFSAEGTMVREWGESGEGRSQLQGPAGIAVAPSGQVLVVDQKNHRVQVFTPRGELLRSIGTPGSAFSQADGELFFPTGVAVDSEGQVYVTDTVHARIQVFDLEGRFLRGWGEPGTGPTQFDRPFGIRVGGDALVYVADHKLRQGGHDRVQVFDRTGKPVRRIGRPGAGPGEINGLMDVALSRDGRLAIVETENHRLQIIEEARK